MQACVPRLEIRMNARACANASALRRVATISFSILVSATTNRFGSGPRNLR